MSSWPTLNIKSWDHFLTISSHVTYGYAGTTTYLFRGQSKAKWLLRPSLLGLLDETITSEKALVIENDLKSEFIAHSRQFLDMRQLESISSNMDWWSVSVMQHHRAPTRLLDWTSSLFVAAYFAIEDHWEENGAIWLFHPNTLVQEILAHSKLSIDIEKAHIDCEVTNAQATSVVLPWFPEALTPRMSAQQGLFTYSPQILSDHENVIDMLLKDAQNEGQEETYRKLIVPHSLKPIFLRMLRAMNITANSLFPDTDGLGRSITELARLSKVFLRE